MRKILIGILLLAVMASGIIYSTLHSPRLMARVVRRVVMHTMPDVRVETLTMQRQFYRWPGQIRWENVQLSVTVKGMAYQADIPEASLDGIDRILSASKVLQVAWKNASLRFTPGEAQGVSGSGTITLGRGGSAVVDGSVVVAVGQWDKLQGTDISFQVGGKTSQPEFSDIQAKALGGTWSGHAGFIVEGLVYSVDLQAEGIDTAQMDDINPHFSTDLTGRARLALKVEGRAQSLGTLEADWVMLPGAKVDAALLSALTQYLPHSREKKRLEAIIKRGGQLPVEVLSFKLRSDSPRHLLGEVKLKSREVNLELNLTNDINTDGTLQSLVEYWQTYLK